jgi:hypothetical protein
VVPGHVGGEDDGGVTFGRGREPGEASRGEEFLEWLRDPLRQELGDGTGAFARWAAEVVDDGEVRAGWLWYPKRLEGGAAGRQFSRADWDDAKAMYISREMRYCEGNGQAEDEVETEAGEWPRWRESCWVAGSCSGACSTGSKP